MEPRKYSVAISVFREKDPIEFAGKVENFTYTDYARDSSDDVSVSVNNYDYKWLTENALRKEDHLVAVIMHREEGIEEKFLNLGDFIIDDVTYSGRPLTGVFKAQSSPVGEDWKDRDRDKSWSNTSVTQVSSDVAANYGLQFTFIGDDTQIENLEQKKQPDSTFLNELLTKYGYSMKIYSQKLIVYQDKAIEAKDAVKEFYEKDFSEWSFNTALTDSYTGAHYNYTNQNSGETYNFIIGTDKKVLEVTEAADSIDEARRITVAELNKKNQGSTTMSVTLKIPEKIVATQAVKVTGLGMIDGKYIVEKVTHTLGQGYTQSLELRKVEEQIGG